MSNSLPDSSESSQPESDFNSGVRRSAKSDLKGPVACDHCNLPVPSGLLNPKGDLQFCCSGCKLAYQLIHEGGLADYYRIADSSTSVPVGKKSSDSLFRQMDNPKFQEIYVSELPDGTQKVIFGIDGLHCAACVWLLEKLPQLVSGVHGARVQWNRSTITIEWSPGQVSLSTIGRTLAGLGYHPTAIRGGEVHDSVIRESRRQWIRIGVAAAAAGNNMLITAALYLGDFSDMSETVAHFLRYCSCLLGIISIVWPGSVFLRGALSAIRTKSTHMDLPVALGLLVGLVDGIVNTLKGSGEIYFDSLSVLVFLLLVGRWIQYRQQRYAADSIELLYRLTPKISKKIEGDSFVEIPTEMVVVGDRLRVLAGDNIPVDGVVTRGSTKIDASILTGESRPDSKKEGDHVSAGTVNLSSAVEMEATAIYSDTKISKILELVNQASQNRPKIVEFANKMGGYFVVTVLSIAMATLLYWLWYEPQLAADRTVALLIVACPCALALATPLSIAVALGRATRRGILIKGGDVLQRLSKGGMVWLDKTGTITTGRQDVTEWIGDLKILPAVACLENNSTHPVAKALCRFEAKKVEKGELPRKKIVFREVDQVLAGGICGTTDEQRICIGSESFVRSLSVLISDQFSKAASELSLQSSSPVFVAVDGEVVAVAGLGDPIRNDAKRSLEQLREFGFQVGILSGDHPQIVKSVAAKLGIDTEFAHGGLSPEEKERFVRESSQMINKGSGQSVMMVGDGVNDSAALASACVGVATKHGAEASLQVAPVYLGTAGLAPLVGLVAGSRAVMRTVMLNLRCSIGYNIFAVILAATGLINPLLAAIIMPISSLTVVGISLLSVAFRKKK